ncbi:MAG TPA: ABC transporter substrate-binding protein [Dehalococcoidales bacterium]|nr:ABC transporter substrate-binding protein [Dehalococcoidales bacterium]
MKTKKLVLTTLAFVILIIMVVTACSSPTTTTPPPTTQAPQTTQAPPATTGLPPAPTVTQPLQTAPPQTTTQAPQTTAPTTAAQPVYGGTLRIIRGSLPNVLGFPPEFGPNDSILAQPVLERLTEWDNKGNSIPLLAERWTVDTTANTITWFLRKGVKFHDGTDFNAETVRWNFQQGIDTRSLTGFQHVKSLDVLDSHTIRMNLATLTTMMVVNYGWRQQISPTAFTNAGGGDFEKSKVWARANSVGTGPFRVVQFQRDNMMRFVKNQNYWRSGFPYLDAIEIRLITDTMTASAMMEAKQADVWDDVSAVQNIVDLTEKRGLKTNWGPGMFWSILPNSSNVNSPTSKKEVREAIELAIDRPALANMIGMGKFEPLTQMAPRNFPGYNDGFNPRPYNVDKAKQLLAAAGYPTGFKTKILITSAGTDAATAIKAYLAAVGIDVTIDIADMGRYFGELFGTGFTNDLVWAASGINPDGTDLFVHFGPTPMTFRTGNILKSQAYLDLCNRALVTFDHAAHMDLLKKAVKQAGDDAMVIPVYRSVANTVYQSYVTTDYFRIHGVIWPTHSIWMDKK